MGTPHTLHDVLDILIQREQEKPNLVTMIRSTGNRISNYLGKEPSAIEAEELLNLEQGLEDCLRTGHYADASIDTHMYLFRKIRGVAEEIMPTSTHEVTRQAWQKVSSALAASTETRTIRPVIEWAIRKEKTPQTITTEDMTTFCEDSVTRRERSYTHAMHLKNRFQRCVVQSGLSAEFPSLSPVAIPPRYGIRTRYMPQPMKGEVEEFLGWMGDPVAEDREREPYRPATIRNIDGFFQEFVGFACLHANPGGNGGADERMRQGLREAQDRLHELLQSKYAERKNIPEIGDLVRAILKGTTSLEQLFTAQMVRAYVSWKVTTRRVQTTTLKCNAYDQGLASGRGPLAIEHRTCGAMPGGSPA
jgi:hypothetical protein